MTGSAQVAGEAAADRLMRQLDYRLSPAGTEHLRRDQVAVVLHALADHTAIEAALVYSRDYPRGSGVPDDAWPTSISVGRWLHDTADQLERAAAAERRGAGDGCSSGDSTL